MLSAVGARFYPKNGHGELVDVDYRIDPDADTGFFSAEYFAPTSHWRMRDTSIAAN